MTETNMFVKPNVEPFQLFTVRRKTILPKICREKQKVLFENVDFRFQNVSSIDLIPPSQALSFSIFTPLMVKIIQMLHVTNYRNNTDLDLKAPWKFGNNIYRSIVLAANFL